MTSLSLVADEARRLVGKVSEGRLRAIGDSLQALCNAHWIELRGAEPPGRVAKVLWETPPPLADLYMALHAAADPRLAEILGHMGAARGLASLVRAEIDRGEPEEARCAYEAMMLFGLPDVGDAVARRVSERLRDQPAGMRPSHPHSSRPPICKALVAIAAETGRCDPKAIVKVVDVLARVQSTATEVGEDALAQRLLRCLEALGITLLGFDGERIRYQLRGRERKPIARSYVAGLLQELGHA
jgi:hypothetical protein